MAADGCRPQVNGYPLARRRVRRQVVSMDPRPPKIVLLLVCISACGTATKRNGSLPQPASSQEQVGRTLATLKTDTWVRVVAGGDTVEGQVIAYESDTLLLREGFAETNRLSTRDSTSMASVLRNDLDALWERGVSTRRARIAGGIVGGVLGAVLGYAAVDSPGISFFGPSYEVHDPTDTEYAIGTVVGSFVGVLLGGITADWISSGTPVWKQLYP